MKRHDFVECQDPLACTAPRLSLCHRAYPGGRDCDRPRNDAVHNPSVDRPILEVMDDLDRGLEEDEAELLAAVETAADHDLPTDMVAENAPAAVVTAWRAIAEKEDLTNYFFQAADELHPDYEVAISYHGPDADDATWSVFHLGELMPSVPLAAYVIDLTTAPQTGVPILLLGPRHEP